MPKRKTAPALLERMRANKKRKRSQRKQRKWWFPSRVERKRINWLAENQLEIEAARRRKKNEPGRGAGRGTDDRDLKEIERDHKKDFVEELRQLSREFPRERLQVLDEGTGHSWLYRDLPIKLLPEVKTKVWRTDIDPAIQGSAHEPVHHVSPEDLVRTFGKNHFHVILSTYGGVTYTKGSQLKAIANIIGALKPGGLASLRVGNTNEFTGGKNVEMRQLRRMLRSYPNLQVKIYPFDEMGNYNIITIRKGKKVPR